MAGSSRSNKLLTHELLIDVVDKEDKTQFDKLFQSISDYFLQPTNIPAGSDIDGHVDTFIRYFASEMMTHYQACRLQEIGVIDREDPGALGAARLVANNLVAAVPFANQICSDVVNFVADHVQRKLHDRYTHNWASAVTMSYLSEAEREKLFVSVAVLVAISLQAQVRRLSTENIVICAEFACEMLKTKLNEIPLFKIDPTTQTIDINEIHRRNRISIVAQMYLMTFMLPKQMKIVPSRMQKGAQLLGNKGRLENQGEEKSKYNARGYLFSARLMVKDEAGDLIPVVDSFTRQEKYGDRLGTASERALRAKERLTSDSQEYIADIDNTAEMESKDSKKKDDKKADRLIAIESAPAEEFDPDDNSSMAKYHQAVEREKSRLASLVAKICIQEGFKDNDTFNAGLRQLIVDSIQEEKSVSSTSLHSETKKINHEIKMLKAIILRYYIEMQDDKRNNEVFPNELKLQLNLQHAVYLIELNINVAEFGNKMYNDKETPKLIVLASQLTDLEKLQKHIHDRTNDLRMLRENKLIALLDILYKLKAAMPEYFRDKSPLATFARLLNPSNDPNYVEKGARDANVRGLSNDEIEERTKKVSELLLNCIESNAANSMKHLSHELKQIYRDTPRVYAIIQRVICGENQQLINEMENNRKRSASEVRSASTVDRAGSQRETSRSSSSSSPGNKGSK